MDQPARDLWSHRLLAGAVRLWLPDGGRRRLFLLAPPTPADRYAAAEAAARAEEEGLAQGMYDAAGVLAFLHQTGGWDDDRERLLARYERDVEAFQVKLYQMAFKAVEREACRRLLAEARAKAGALRAARHAYDHLTAAGQAAVARARHLVGAGLRRPDGSPVWRGEEFWDADDPLLDEALREYNRTRPPEAVVREVARTDPWRGYWACRQADGLFGRPAAELTDDQRHLVAWTRVYDSAHEDPDCPPDEVVADDDMFDGWLTLRRREREAEAKKRRADAGIGNDKIARAGEVFILNARPGEASTGMTADEIAAVDALNDEQAALDKRRRMAAVRAKGAVLEAQMPDSKEKILAQFAARHRPAAKE